MKILEIHNFINEGGPIIEVVDNFPKFLEYSGYTTFWESYTENIPYLINVAKGYSKWTNKYFRIIKMQELDLK